MLEQHNMKCPSRPVCGHRLRRITRSWLRVSAALLVAVGCSLNPRPEDPGFDQGSNLPGNLGEPAHTPADASFTPPPSGGGTSNQGGVGGGFSSSGGAGASGPVAAIDGGAQQADDAAGPGEAGTLVEAGALDGGEDASDAARGDGG